MHDYFHVVRTGILQIIYSLTCDELANDACSKLYSKQFYVPYVDTKF